MAAELPRDTLRASWRDAEVAVVQELLRDSLEALTTVRDDALCTT